MAYVLGIEISIGGYKLTRANSVKIERSCNLIADTATITLPITAVVQSNGVTTTTETAKLITAGMPVQIKLAYTGVYEGVEFTGYVKRVNKKIPLEVECEDAIYLLRKSNINKAWTSVTLSDVMKEIVQGTTLKVSETMPTITLAPFSIKNATGAWALQEIRDKYGLTIYVSNNTLYAGLAYADNNGTVVYTLTGDNTNVIDASSLQFRDKEDVKLKVKAIGIHADNTRTEVEVGDSSGELRTLNFYNVTSKDELQKLAQQQLDKLKFDGYEGKLKTFLIPVAIPGMRAKVKDNLFPERAGSYYIESVTTTWGVDGASREVEIGPAMS